MNPECACHGVEMRWNRDPRYKAGGYWRCGVGDAARKRARYANDPVYRISNGIRNAARSRRLHRRRTESHAPSKLAAALLTVKRPRS